MQILDIMASNSSKEGAGELRECVGSLLLPVSDLQELSNIQQNPEVTLKKRRTTARIGEFLPDNVDDPKSHPYHNRAVVQQQQQQQQQEEQEGASGPRLAEDDSSSLIVKFQRRFTTEMQKPPPDDAEADYWND
mmetsp:Transcript_54953/g.152198  ORF Transcript_54953/g.152198 Transcript_54953/m.152198 type:complete len:134 (-) Transcript_54953:109-510(-)